eukprot:5243796-Amphidinium_carterae.4
MRQVVFNHEPSLVARSGVTVVFTLCGQMVLAVTVATLTFDGVGSATIRTLVKVFGCLSRGSRTLSIERSFRAAGA